MVVVVGSPWLRVGGGEHQRGGSPQQIDIAQGQPGWQVDGEKLSSHRLIALVAWS